MDFNSFFDGSPVQILSPSKELRKKSMEDLVSFERGKSIQFLQIQAKFILSITLASDSETSS